MTERYTGAGKPTKFTSYYSPSGKWDDQVEFEYVRYYAAEYGDAIEIDGRPRFAKRYAYLLPDGRWLCGTKPRDRKDDKEPLHKPQWLDAPDFELAVPVPDSPCERLNEKIGHLFRGYDQHLYRIVDAFFFGSPGWDVVIEPVDVDPAGRPEDARFRWISSAAVDRTFHHSRQCPCRADLRYGAR